MAAPLSVVIPTLNAASDIGPCLNALMSGVMSSVVKELIIVDGGSTDQTAEIADAAGARLIEAEPGRGHQLATGADAAQGEWLLFLHADTILAPGWDDAVLSFIEQGTGEKAAAFQFALDDQGLWPGFMAMMVRLRCGIFRLPYGDQGLLISRTHYNRLGGFSNLPLMEDVDLIRKIGWGNIRSLKSLAVTSAARYRGQGYLRRSLFNLSCLAMYFAGVAPEKIARRYYGKPSGGQA